MCIYNYIYVMFPPFCASTRRAVVGGGATGWIGNCAQLIANAAVLGDLTETPEINLEQNIDANNMQ